MKRLIFVGSLALFMAGCCCNPAAMKAIDRGISTNKGHMVDSGLPQKAREIAQDNYDVFNQVKFSLDGTALPEDTAARSAARTPKPAEGGGE